MILCLTPPLGRSRLREWIKKQKKSQTDLADHLTVSRSYITQVCNNEVQLSVYNMRKTAKYLNCNMDDLIFWEGELAGD